MNVIIFLLMLVLLIYVIVKYDKVHAEKRGLETASGEYERQKEKSSVSLSCTYIENENHVISYKEFINEIDRVLKLYYPDIVTWKCSIKDLHESFSLQDCLSVNIFLQNGKMQTDILRADKRKIQNLYEIGWFDEEGRIISPEQLSEEQIELNEDSLRRLHYGLYESLQREKREKAKAFSSSDMRHLNEGEANTAYSCNLKNEDDKIGCSNVFVPDGPLSFQEIDIILLSHHGIFCIESKLRNGRLFIENWNNDWVIRNSKEDIPFVNPLKQNQQHVMALQNLIYKKIKNLRRDIPFYNIVHLSGSRWDSLKIASESIRSVSDRLKVDGELFVNAKLDDYMESFDDREYILKDDELSQIYEVIRPYTELSEKEKKEYMALRKDFLSSKRNRVSKELRFFKHEEDGIVSLTRRNDVYAQIYNPEIETWCYIAREETEKDIPVEDSFEILEIAHNNKVKALWE